MPILELLTGPFSGVITDNGDARIAYEHSVAKVPSDRRIVGVLLGANNSFQLKVGQATAMFFCISRVSSIFEFHPFLWSVQLRNQRRSPEQSSARKLRRPTSRMKLQMT